MNICEDITRNGGSNLWYMARLLPKIKYQFFCACYAAMRVIDDYVDDDFQLRTSARRDAGRAQAISIVDTWEQLISASSSFVENDDIYSIIPSFRLILPDLKDHLQRSNLSSHVWPDLARALKMDINETAMTSWADFTSYAQGATVSPAYIFLFVLAGDCKDNGIYLDPKVDLSSAAKLMGEYCYLVHIMRDFEKDALQSRQMITIPQDVLDHCGISFPLSNNPTAITNLMGQLSHRAVQCWDAIVPLHNKLEDELGLREALALKSLLKTYHHLHKKIDQQTQDGRDIARASEMTNSIRMQILKDEGLDDYAI